MKNNTLTIILVIVAILIIGYMTNWFGLYRAKAPTLPPMNGNGGITVPQ